MKLLLKTSGYFAALALAPFLTACAAGPPEPEPTATPTYDASTFFETVTVRGASFSADESRLLMTSDETGIFNVYAQPVDGGPREALTASTTQAHFAVSYFPGDDRFLYTADQGGNELNHLYVQELDGTATDLTPGENLKATFLGWSDDEQTFWGVTNERDPQFFDVYRYRTAGYEREEIFRNTSGFNPFAVSGDGRWLALLKPIDNRDSDIYIADLESPEAEPRLVTAHEDPAQHIPLEFGPESQRLYYVTDGKGEFMQAWSYDLESREHRPVVEADWDVMYLTFSDSGRYRTVATNEDARTLLTVLDTESGLPVALPELPEGDVTGVLFDKSESLMAFSVVSDTSPANLHVLNLDSGEHVKLTETLNAEIASEDLVDGEVVRYPSYDDLEIPAVLYRPHSASAQSPAPALVWVHGGPGGQSRKGYRAEIQHLVNHGYAILAVNNRGSSGYGKTFNHMDDQQHGDVDLKDCVWGRKYLEGLDWVDGSKVGIIGGSYGGYMVAAALAFEPEAFDLGIDIFGVTNWIRTLENIPPWWTAMRDSLYAEMGDPATDQERLRRISPLFHASNIVKPLLVVQGANDPRVLQVESDELVAAAEANGVPVEYIIFPDEGHGFRNRTNRITASDRFVAFLDHHLNGAETSSAETTE